MAHPIALCLEDVGATDASRRFVRCTALVGRQPGLRIGPACEIGWQSEAAACCELWVSADERLVAYRPAGAAPVVLDRAGRCLELPVGKPVVLVDQDELVVAARRLRLHVHGLAPSIGAPAPLPPRARSSAAHLAAVVAVGAAVVGCDRPATPPPVDVRDHPPEIAAPPRDTAEPVEGAGTAASPFASPPPPGPIVPADPPAVTATTAASSPPIEVRDHPPEAPAE